MRKRKRREAQKTRPSSPSIDDRLKQKRFILTLRMSMNCLEPTLSAWTRKALSYVSSSLQSLASYC